jgi:uncharacterized SAM-binding protein YcdF (DUF218 family)
MDTFALLKILVGLILPPASLAVGVVLFLVLMLLGAYRLARAVLFLAIAETLILSFPPVGDALIGPLEYQARAAARLAPPCCYEAIVVLGGGIAPANPPDRLYPDLNENADRIWETARLYRRGLAKRIIVSGGSFADHGGAQGLESDAMRIFLVDLGVPVEAIQDEPRAQNTIQNIRNVRAMVGDGRVALVTSAYHMPRSLKLAARAGMKVGAFPTDYRAIPGSRLPWDNWMPSIDGLGLSIIAIKEIIALNLDFRSASLEP